MSKDVSSNISTAIEAAGQKPINLYIVFLDDATLYFCAYPTNLQYFSWDTVNDQMSTSPQTYYAIAIEHGEIRTNADTRVDQVDVRLDNINNLMATYVARTELRGRRLIIVRTYEDYIANYDDHIVLFDGLIDNPVVSEKQMQVTVKSRLGSLSSMVPRRLYDVSCNWQFGSTECALGKESTGISGLTVASGTTTTIWSSGLSESTNYWRYGDIKLISAGSITGEKRRVIWSSGSQINLDYALSSGVLLDNTFNIWRGCDKTYNWCSGLGNLSNYGGFPTIPQLMVIR